MLQYNSLQKAPSLYPAWNLPTHMRALTYASQYTQNSLATRSCCPSSSLMRQFGQGALHHGGEHCLENHCSNRLETCCADGAC